MKTWPCWLLGLFVSLWVTTSAFAQTSTFTAAKVEDGTDCNWPFSAMATNPVDGKIYALWRKGANENVTYKLIRWDGSGWATVSTFTTASGTTSSIKVPDFSGGADFVSLAIDAAGRFHVAFKGTVASVGREAVWYGLSPTGTTWSFQPLQALPANSINQSLSDQVIEVDPQNQPHVAFLYTDAQAPRTYTLRYFRLVSGSWVGETAITQSGTTPGGRASNEIGQFDLAIDRNAKAHFSFRRETNGSGRDGSLYYLNNTSGSWSTPQELVAGNTAEAQAVTNTIDTDANNNVHIVHSDYQRKLYYTTNESGSFVTTQINGNVTGAVNSQHTLRINGKGDKFVVYNDNAGSPTELNYAYQLAGTSGSWTTGTAYTPTEAGNGGNYYSGLMSDDRRIMVLFDNSLTSTRGQCSEFRRDLWYATATVQAPTTVAPTVTTGSASAIATNSATLGGNVTTDGGATVRERGVVYSSTNTTPTVGGNGVTTAPNGTGTGTFSAVISGLTAGTTYSVRAYATNSVGTSYGSAQTFTTSVPTITVAPPTLPNGTVGVAYSQAITGSGGTAPYTFALTAGTLPPGMMLSSGGVLSGTPTGGGTYAFTIRATDASRTGSGPYSGSRSYTFTIAAPTITLGPATLPTGTIGAAYSQTVTASGGTSPYTYAVTAGALPSGLTLSSTGVLSGTPTDGSTSPFTITATDVSTGTGPYAGSRSYTLTIVPPTLSGLAVTPATVCTGGIVTVTATIGQNAGTYSYTLLYGGQTIRGTTTTAVSQTLTAGGSGQQTITLRAGTGASYNTATTTLTVNPLPVVSITNLASAYCQDAANVILVGSPAGATGSFTIDGSGGAEFTPMSLTVGQHTVGYRFTDGNGCSNSTSQTVTIKATPPAPSLLTQTGQSYPGSQSAVTVDLNTGNVTLVASGCAGTVNWTGPNNTAGTGTSILVPTTQAGAFTYQASCTIDGCASPLATARITVGGRLTLLHRDVDNYADNNAIQPLLQIQNQGAGPLPLAKLTLRYYVTVEGGGTLGNLSVSYAQVGNQNVRLRYVALNPAQQGSSGYVEYSFTDGAGNLAAGANSGSIQGYFTKSDYGSLFEPDDYSYNPIRNQLTGNLRITAYYDGMLIAGLEPGSTTQIRAVRALTESKNGPDATQINTYLDVRNEGNVAIDYSDLKARYYFTADGNERLQVEVDEGNVSTRLVKLPQAVNGADTYLELTFNQGGQLAPGASTGTIRYRISKPDGGRFNQANDYSYQEQPQERSQNTHLVVLVSSQVAWGQLPAGASARRMTSPEPGSELSVKLLGNPIVGGVLEAEVTGAQGQPLTVQLTDLQGRSLGRQGIERAGVTERINLNVGSGAAGLLLLQVSTPMRSQVVKVLGSH